MPYRPYIDGLRAIAVGAVIFFHFDQAVLPGGFLGVDIFFVISGFLITQLLFEPSDLPWLPRLGQFYLRRARRILPALLVTALVVLAAALVLYLPDDLVRLGKYLLLTPLMLANLASALDGGYFGVTDAFLPLKHFWSLAVEEQFYAVYPLICLLLCARADPPRRVAVISAMAFLSIVVCIRGEMRHAAGTFYLMPARAWELMFGALAAAVPLRSFASRPAREVTVAVCLATIVAGFFLLSAATGFPHPYATIPCAATAILLLVGRTQAAAAFRLLSLRPLVFTGKISYSLYLWHAPVLAFVQYYAIRDLSVAARCGVFVAVYAISVLSWLWVETPIRQKVVLGSDRSFLLIALAMSLVTCAAGALLWGSDGLPWRFAPDIQVLTQPDDLPQDSELCMNLPLQNIAAGELCRVGPSRPGSKTVVVWGDSHAGVLIPVVEQLARSHDLEVWFAGRTSCRPLRGVAAPSADLVKQTGCTAFNDAMNSAVRRLHPDVTILSAFWDADNPQSPVTPLAAPWRAQDLEADWTRTIAPLRAAGSKVCVVLDAPVLPYMLPYALAMARRRGLDTSFVYVRRADVLRRYEPFEAAVAALAATGALVSVDPKSVICPSARCEIEENGSSLYRDWNHLTRLAVLHLTETLEKCLQ